jgi:glutathione peroxidase
MRAMLALILAWFGLGAPARAAAPGEAYQFSFEKLEGGSLPLSAYKGKAVLVVNTASKCGFTPQYEGLQKLWADKKDEGLVILGVPSGNFAGQEFGKAKEIEEFCKIRYGVDFPLAAKTDVIGKGAHPFYVWAKETLGPAAAPKWNFHKILIGKDGRPVAAFGSGVKPESPELTGAISAALR